MTRVHIKTLKPMMFENRFFIIGIDVSWSNLFNDIAFDVDIVNGFLRIQSTQTIRK